MTDSAVDIQKYKNITTYTMCIKYAKEYKTGYFNLPTNPNMSMSQNQNFYNLIKYNLGEEEVAVGVGR